MFIAAAAQHQQGGDPHQEGGAGFRHGCGGEVVHPHIGEVGHAVCFTKAEAGDGGVDVESAVLQEVGEVDTTGLVGGRAIDGRVEFEEGGGLDLLLVEGQHALVRVEPQHGIILVEVVARCGQDVVEASPEVETVDDEVDAVHAGIAAVEVKGQLTDLTKITPDAEH